MNDDLKLVNKKLNMFAPQNIASAKPDYSVKQKLEKKDYKLNVDNPKLDFNIVQETTPPKLPTFSDELYNGETTIDAVDYNICVPDKDGNVPEPSAEYMNAIDKDSQLSFLEINNIKNGEEWYRHNFPKVPDQLYPIMARYNWGDLKSHTTKSVKQEVKKKMKKPPKMEIKHGNFVIDFQ